MSGGWIKIFRALKKWGWYDSPNCVQVFIDILLHANHEQNEYRGVIIPAGSFTTSQQKIAQRTGLSVHQVRLVLDKLSSTNDIAVKTNRHYSMISVTNWKNYQEQPEQNAVKAQSDLNQERSQVATSKKLRSKEEKKGNREVAPTGYKPLIDLFCDEPEIKAWLETGRAKVQAQLFETYENAFLILEIMSAHDWMIGKRTKRGSDAFLAKWLGQSKGPAYKGGLSPEQRQAEKDLLNLLSGGASNG